MLLSPHMIIGDYPSDLNIETIQLKSMAQFLSCRLETYCLTMFSLNS